MLNKTFPEQVQNELDKRVLFNQMHSGFQETVFTPEHLGVTKDYHNWLARTPYIFVYSNVRYPNQSKQQLEYTVLSSQKIREVIQQPLTYQQDFFEHYQNSDKFGITPKPVVTELTVEGRQTSNHTLRQVTLKIQCYSYEQLLMIRKYFSLPTTSLFIQYGLFTSEELFKNKFFLPAIDDKDYQLKKMQQQDSYFNQDQVKKRYKDCPTMDYIYGDIYGFDFDQESFQKFTITVKMMTRNLSTLLQYINPQQYTVTANEIKDKDQHSSKKFTKSIVNVLDQMVAMNIFSDNKQVIVPTTNNAQKYVTYNWVANVVGVLLKFLTLKLYTETPPFHYFLPPLIFSFQSGMDAKVLSYSQDVLFFFQKNDKTKQAINQELDGKELEAYWASTIQKTQKIYIQKLETLFNKSLSLRAQPAKNIKLPNETQYLNAFNELYQQSKDQFNSMKLDMFGWFGNTYIRYSKIKEIIEGNKQLSIASFFSQILNMLNASTGLATNFSFSQTFNYLGNYLELSMVSNKIFIPTPYRINNIGNESIVRQYSTTFNLPDAFKASLLFSNLSVQKKSKNNIYNALFRLDDSVKPIDLMQFYSIKDQEALDNIIKQSTTPDDETQNKEEQTKKQKNLQKIKTTVKTANYLKGGSVKIDFDKLKQQNVSKAIVAYNQDVVEEFKKNRNKYLIGQNNVYKIENQVTLDFISGIHYGQVFTLAFNPMGWDSKFFVNNIKHLIAKDKAETQLFGYIV